MKRSAAVLLAVMMICAALLCACGEGISVSYFQIMRSNSPDMKLSSDGKYPAMREKITYYSDGTEDYSYTLYIEATDDYSAPYGIIERCGGYTLYIRSGNIFAEKDGQRYEVLLTAGSFYDFADKYITFESDFDSGKYYQMYSSREGDITTVAYYTELLPEVAAKYSSWEFVLGDRLISEFEIADDFTARRVTYYLEKNDVKTKLMTREFEYLTKADETFPGIPTEERDVLVVYAAGTPIEYYQTFSVPDGFGFGFDTGGRDISFYLDPEYTVPFDFLQTATGDISKVYAKTN